MMHEVGADHSYAQCLEDKASLTDLLKPTLYERLQVSLTHLYSYH